MYVCVSKTLDDGSQRFKMCSNSGKDFCKPTICCNFETRTKPKKKKNQVEPRKKNHIISAFTSPTVSTLINRRPQPPRPLSPTCSSARPPPPSRGARRSRGTTYPRLSPRARGWTRPPRPTRRCETEPGKKGGRMQKRREEREPPYVSRLALVLLVSVGQPGPSPSYLPSANS